MILGLFTSVFKGRLEMIRAQFMRQENSSPVAAEVPSFVTLNSAVISAMRGQGSQDFFRQQISLYKPEV